MSLEPTGGDPWSRPPGRDAWTPTEPLPLVPLPSPPRRRGVVVLMATLAVALVVAGLAVGRMLQVNAAWQRSSTQWQALARTHGEQLAQAQADLQAAQDELTATRSQLDAAQQRITQLADEKAKLGDTTAAQQQLADYQARVSQAAGKVATSLATCIDGQNKLISYLDNAAAYDATSLAGYGTDVQSYCDQAKAANTALQHELSR